MWSSLTVPGRLGLLSGRRRDLRDFHQELAHHALRTHPGTVLWCDGDHGFDPYDLAELNLTRGLQADDGAERVLVKRCISAFQWDTVLTKHLPEKLEETDASLVLAAPYDRLFVHEELRDWEQEDYVRYSLGFLRDLARRRGVPILLSVDMERWWRTHPVLAQMTYEAVDARWGIARPDGRWHAREDTTGAVVDPYLRRQVTLLDFVEESVPVPVPLPRAR